MSECKHLVTFCDVCQTCKRKLDGEEIAERKAYWKREDEKRRACQRRSTKLRDAERAVLDACVEESKALDDVRARPNHIRARKRHTDAIYIRAIKVRSYRALIDAESK